PLPASAIIGRGEGCDIVLEDGSVSRRHARLARDERGHYRIEDLGSANGTFVDGARIAAPTPLSDGVKLRFGDVELLFWRPPARREQIAQKLFADASTKAQVGREEEALQMFARLDPQSRFFPRARIKAKELAQTLLRSHSSACKLAASRAQLQLVVDVCARAL